MHLIPSFSIVLEISVEIAEIFHLNEIFYGTPVGVCDELDRAYLVGLDRKTQQKVELYRVDLLVVEQYLECHLSCEDQFVAFKEAAGGVLEHLERDRVREVLHSNGDFVVLYGSLDCHVEDNTEGLQGELVHGVDLVHVVEDEVEHGGSGSCGSVQLPSLVDLVRSLLRLRHLCLNLCRRLLCVLKILNVFK